MAAKWSYVDKSRAERITRLPALTAAAESDDVEAQVVLAWEYASGEIVYPDIATAWRWFERAAASGDENAIVQYARFLQLRRAPDGVRRLRKLAATGNWKAQFCLAQQYQGRPGRLNQLRAVIWFERSFQNGNPFGRAAKTAQLRRLVSTPIKLALYFVTAFDLIIAIRRLLRDDSGQRYEQLAFRLHNRR
jgi:hypothetical protein